MSTGLPQLRAWLDALLERQALSTDDARALLVGLTDPEVPPALAGALLAAVRAKGVTPEELRGFALGMRALARRPHIADTAWQRRHRRHRRRQVGQLQYLDRRIAAGRGGGAAR